MHDAQPNTDLREVGDDESDAEQRSEYIGCVVMMLERSQ